MKVQVSDSGVGCHGLGLREQGRNFPTFGFSSYKACNFFAAAWATAVLASRAPFRSNDTTGTVAYSVGNPGRNSGPPEARS